MAFYVGLTIFKTLHVDTRERFVSIAQSKSFIKGERPLRWLYVFFFREDLSLEFRVATSEVAFDLLNFSNAGGFANFNNNLRI